MANECRNCRNANQWAVIRGDTLLQSIRNQVNSVTKFSEWEIPGMGHIFSLETFCPRILFNEKKMDLIKHKILNRPAANTVKIHFFKQSKYLWIRAPFLTPWHHYVRRKDRSRKFGRKKNMAGNQSDGLLNDQSKKISVCGGCTILGQPPPEDPVCDSGIYCYGKSLTHLSTYFCKYLLQA